MMLHLKAATPEDWADRARQAIPEILLDHAHCEKKAASTALSLIFRYPEYPQWVRPLTALAREELSHFEMVLDHLEERKIPYGRQKPSPYVGKLMSVIRNQEPGRLLDTLLCCALIEARSCERMKLLSEALPRGDLKDFYAGLLASEARHHILFVDLALSAFPKEMVETRLDVLSAHESEVLASPPKEPRLHN